MDNKKTANYLFVAFIIIGVGIGMYIRKPAVGAVLGVGVGFLIKALYLQRRN